MLCAGITNPDQCDRTAGCSFGVFGNRCQSSGGGGGGCTSNTTQSACQAAGCSWNGITCHEGSSDPCASNSTQQACVSAGCNWGGAEPGCHSI